jgi:hypothetical protein
VTDSPDNARATATLMQRKLLRRKGAVITGVDVIRFLVPDLNKFIARLSILHRLFDPATARSERGEEPNEESPPPESRSVVMCAVYRETVRIL